jgi:hypothetical protein
LRKGTYPFIVQIGCGLNCNIKSLAAQHPRPITRAAILRKITGLVRELCTAEEKRGEVDKEGKRRKRNIPHGDLWFGCICRFNELGHYDVFIHFEAELFIRIATMIGQKKRFRKGSRGMRGGTYANCREQCSDESGPISDPSPPPGFLPLA